MIVKIDGKPIVHVKITTYFFVKSSEQTLMIRVFLGVMSKQIDMVFFG